LAKGFRSGFEGEVSDQIAAVTGLPAAYEQVVVDYITPATKHKYHPDFQLPSGILIETKGRFVPADRKKHLLVKAQHPELDIRLVFYNERAKLSKTSKTTYADWCEKNGIKWARKLVPAEWFAEAGSDGGAEGT
jgi:hypothetical protein